MDAWWNYGHDFCFTLQRNTGEHNSSCFFSAKANKSYLSSARVWGQCSLIIHVLVWSTHSPGVRSLLRYPRFTTVLWRCSQHHRTLPWFCVCGQNVHTGQDFLCCLSQHALHVTDKAVHVALACRLVDDILVVVVAQAAAQLLVIHLGFVLALTPALGHLLDGSKQRWAQVR